MKSTTRKVLAGTVLVAIVLLVLGAAYSWHVLRSSLPQLDGEVAVTGVREAAWVERDSQGIVTVRAVNRADAAFATGFAHGQDRFFQMDLTRRKAAGELSELFGAAALELDKKSRLHRFRARARAVTGGMDVADAAVLDAYVAGVNAGLASLSKKPFEYYLLGAEPRPWNAEDSMLVAYAMFMVLNDERAASDYRRGLAQAVLPAAAYDWLYQRGTEWDAPLMGEARDPVPMPSAAEFSIAGRSMAASPDVSRYADAAFPGSNNWAVSGRLTPDGRAIVANDMHLEITVPNVFYRARVVVERDQLNVSGLTLPGTPLVIAGSNGRVAWGFTNSYGDWSDAVILTIDDEGRYLTPDGPREFKTYEESILVKGRAPETYSVRETIWGPVLDDAAEDRAIAVAWIAHAPHALNLAQLKLESAASVEDALNIANTMGMPPQNFVAGDADGNIGWTLTGIIPRRGAYDAWLPADWSDGNGWQGWLRPEEYPRVVNPPSGRIWTANARVADGEALRLIGDGGYDLGARQQQIRDGLMARDRMNIESMLEVQTDDRAIFLARWQALLVDLLSRSATSAERAEYQALVESWIPRASVESVGYRLVRNFRQRVRVTVFEMMMLPVREVHGEETELRLSNQFEGPLWQMVNEQPVHLLSDNFDSWDALLLEAVDAQIADYAREHRDGLVNRTWGERNTAAIRHPVSRAMPALSSWLDMPADALGGDSNLPKVVGPAFGASERFAVSPGNEAGSYLHMPAGQSGHPLSAFYRAGHADWVNAVPSAFLPGDARHKLVLLAQ